MSGAGIYVDMVSAFYSIIREHLMPCTTSDHAIAHLFWTLGLDAEAVHQLAELLADPPAFDFGTCLGPSAALDECPLRMYAF